MNATRLERRDELVNTESRLLFFHHANIDHPDVDNLELSVRSGTYAPGT